MLEKVRKSFWGGEVLDDYHRVVIGHPVGHHRGASIDGHAALMERPPKLLCHVIWTQSILECQVELVACHKIHEFGFLASSGGSILQIFWKRFVVQAFPKRVHLQGAMNDSRERTKMRTQLRDYS